MMIDWDDTDEEDTKQNQLQLLSNEELSDEEASTNKLMIVDPGFQKLRDELKTRARDILQRESELTEEEDQVSDSEIDEELMSEIVKQDQDESSQTSKFNVALGEILST